jgi:cell division protein FtsL
VGDEAGPVPSPQSLVLNSSGGHDGGITTTYFEVGRGWAAQVAERNAELFALQSLRRRGARTPEFYFSRHIDNSRLVKAAGPGASARQMRMFSVAVALLFSLVMIYGLQHFYAIEGGYRVESEKQMRDQLREENRQLRLSEAQLSQPGRIDQMARQMGFTEPQPGQVIHANVRPDGATPTMAQATPPGQ